MLRNTSLLIAVLSFFASLGAGQGIMLPPERHPIVGSYAIKAISVEGRIKDQVAQIQVSQTFVNTSSRDMEVQFLFPFPADGAIDRFTLMVDGKELEAILYTHEEARRIYESIVRSRRDPALLEYMGYGALQTSVFPLPSNGERTVTLKYSQICRRDGQITEFLYPLSSAKLAGKPVGEVKLNLAIDSAQAIKSVYSPTHSLTVERSSELAATVKLSQKDVTVADDLRLFWSLSEKAVGATVFSYKPENEDGYFLLLASPEVRAATAAAPPPKSVIFVLDKSGSMEANKKIEQAKGALRFVLNSLREGDTFNIITYDSKVESFKPELQRNDEETRKAAMAHIDGIFAGGSTNIDEALQRAMDMIGQTERPTYVIFLTDGLPTAGEQNEAKIAEHCKTANKSHVRLFAFGVGFDVNARLLDRLSTGNFGVSDYVKPTEDIEAVISRFYAKMSAPVLANLKIELAGATLSRTFPKDLPDLFAGGQLIWVGRYKDGGDVNIKLSGKVGPVEQAFEFPAKLSAKAGDETHAFVEKLWASRRIGEILNELDLGGKNKELIDELVALSTRHGILTPYTAFLADERTDLRAREVNALKAGENLDRGLVANTGGSAGVYLREQKASLQYTATAPAQGMQAYKDDKGLLRTESNCQVVGNQAMYRRNNRWVDATITEDEEKKAEVVEQFSDKYFELARDNAPLRRFLAMPDGCTVRVNNKVYQINAAQTKE